ncbi:MAG: hypothetical protein ACOC34_07535, partial [Thermotogota bacterium]
MEDKVYDLIKKYETYDNEDRSKIDHYEMSMPKKHSDGLYEKMKKLSKDLKIKQEKVLYPNKAERQFKRLLGKTFSNRFDIGAYVTKQTEDLIQVRKEIDSLLKYIEEQTEVVSQYEERLYDKKKSIAKTTLEAIED